MKRFWTECKGLIIFIAVVSFIIVTPIAIYEWTTPPRLPDVTTQGTVVDNDGFYITFDNGDKYQIWRDYIPLFKVGQRYNVSLTQSSVHVTGGDWYYAVESITDLGSPSSYDLLGNVIIDPQIAEANSIAFLFLFVIILIVCVIVLLGIGTALSHFF